MLTDIQEILEGSIWQAIMDQLVKYGYAPDPANFELNGPDLVTLRNADTEYDNAIKDIINNHGFSIGLFNASNSQYKGLLDVPRIVITTQSVIPGALGNDTAPIYELVGDYYVKKRSPSMAVDYFFNVYLVANTIKQLRILGAILIEAFPRRGYIKTYLDENIVSSGNLMVEFTGYMDSENIEEGVMEKVNSYKICDIFEALPQEIPTTYPISPIKEINILNIKIE